MNELTETTPKSYIKYIIYCYGAFAWMCATLTMPLTLPLSHQFGTSPHVLQVGISVLLFCFAISQFIGGSLSDMFGRKKIVLSFLFLIIQCLGIPINMIVSIIKSD